MERALRELGSVIFVSHRLDEVMRVCDRIMVMHEGALKGIVNAVDTSPERLLQLAMS